MTSQLPDSQYSGAVGPKVFPYIAAIGLLLCSIGIFFHKPHGKATKPFMDRAGWVRILKLSLLLALYPVMFIYLGFIVASIVLLFVMITMFDLEKEEPLWKRSLVSLVTTGALYVLFVHLINIRLPAGKLFELLR